MQRRTIMGRKSSIPDEILQYRPCKCVRLRNDGNGVYRVYKYSALQLPSGEWSNDWGYLIGKIVANEGFFPNKRYQKELEEQKEERFSDSITDVAYGQYALLQLLSKDVLEKLNECFLPERAAQIYSYALILCAQGFVHLDQVSEFFMESIMSLQYSNYSFKMGYDALSGLLHDLGMKGNPVKKFEQLLIDNSSKKIAIDGHVIRSCSWNNDLAEPGYKLRSLKSPQINVLIAYDTANKAPLMYRTYRGSSVDKKSVIEFLQSRSFTNVKFVVDRGFYSSNVLELMSKNGNSYIIPLQTSNSHWKRIKKTLSYSSGEFVYKVSARETARIIYYEEQIDNDTRICVFKDVDENNSKRKCYQQMIDLGEEGYTQENYNQFCEWWGVYVLQDTTKQPAPAVYSDYKDRWSIETYNNYIKNDADFNDLKNQDYYCAHGFDFIMLVTGLIHSRLNEAVKALKKPSISTIDVLIKAGHMRMVQHENQWQLHNTRKKDIELFNSMGFIPQESYQHSGRLA